ncbi:hypothetical protein VCUG_00148 [Vavraia culicis subsp. floridensis]|uniref:Uncharacterized protein n=1 Tax=Vavraia culicis (isolate floridensis) TaxID=948595 RepID=L2GY88_VAVCU|nr:uncharacterized protein VCUG_00148 [Vavraia culicis subsp. floridensis]ELA48312.2 hypothetical protein VCUG_00148 [Vavraia culicis subsp. floridensis]
MSDAFIVRHGRYSYVLYTGNGPACAVLTYFVATDVSACEERLTAIYSSCLHVLYPCDSSALRCPRHIFRCALFRMSHSQIVLPVLPFPIFVGVRHTSTQFIRYNPSIKYRLLPFAHFSALRFLVLYRYVLPCRSQIIRAGRSHARICNDTGNTSCTICTLLRYTALVSKTDK